MKFIVIILLNFLLSSFGSGGSLSPAALERVRNLTLEGLHSAYNFDFDAANKSFAMASEVEPLHPRPYVGKAMILLWRCLLNKNEADQQAFFFLADRAIDAAEKYQDQFGEDAESKLCLGTIYGYRAFVQGRAKSYIKAAWDGKKSHDYFNDALQLDPQTYDAYLGLGVFHYFLDFMPKPMRWVASLMGVSGDAVTGIKEIRIAAQKGIYCKIEAQYYLAQFMPWMDGDFDSGEKILTELSNQYPANTLIEFTRAVWEIRRHDVLTAQRRLTSIVENNNSPLGDLKQYAQYKLAECYFRLGDYNNAKAMYQSFLRNYSDETYRATSNYRIGICYEIENNRDSALVYYRNAVRADRKFGDDAYSARKAQQMLRSPLESADTLLLTMQNAIRSGDYEKARAASSQLSSTTGIFSDMESEAEYLRGESHIEQQTYTLALPFFQSIASKKIEGELWLLPWAHYQSGLCFKKLHDNKSAKREFEQALDYDDYDFQNWLEFRSKRELMKIEKNSNR